MRIQSCSSGTRVRVPISSWLSLWPVLVGIFACGPSASPVQAQWPGEILLIVLDAPSGRPVSGARVDGAGMAFGTTGRDGRLLVANLEQGFQTIHVRAAGYHEGVRRLNVRSGRRTLIEMTLEPTPLVLEGLEVRASAPQSAGFRFSREEIEASAARSVGDLIGRAPGVLVRQDVPGGPQSVSIRGGDPSSVLVLVDGTPVNDPLTGVADLSLVGLAGVHSITVVPGAASAREGAGALSGVIRVERGPAGGGPSASVSLGSLGARATALEWSGRSAHLAATARSVRGGFDFHHPPEAGGGPARRRNADATEWQLAAGATRETAGHRLSGDLAVGGLERGLPGKGFQQADSAREEVRRGHATLAWEGPVSSRGNGAAHVSARWVRRENRDPAPPAGQPFATRSQVLQLTTRITGDRAIGSTFLGGGLALDHLRIRSGALDGAPASRTDLGGFLDAGAPLGRGVTARLRTRVDAAVGAQPVWSHDLSAEWVRGATTLTLSHRSAFRPPALSDQYFREGVAVRPNPDLGPERIPGEWEVTAGWTRPRVAIGASAFLGDIRGRIVWLPDFRFIWSPRNTDVQRRGAEVHARGDLGPLSLRGRYAWARVTYDRATGDDVQVAYRPRHTGGVGATWVSGPWTVTLDGDFLGSRFPVPNAVNALPAFWSWRIDAGRRWSVGDWQGTASFAVDRIRDGRDTLIFGFPSPGRTLRLAVRVGRSTLSPTESP